MSSLQSIRRLSPALPPGPPTLEPDGRCAAAHLATLAGLGIAGVATDLDGVITHVNQPAAELYGRSCSELLGMSALDIGVPPACAAAAATLVVELLRRGSAGRELEVLDAADAPLHVDVRARLLLDGAGSAAGCIAALSPIGARVEAERRAARSEARLALARHIPKWGTWQWDLQTDTLLSSESFAQLLNLDACAHLSMAEALASLDAETRAQASRELARLRGGEIDSATFTYRAGGGERQRWLEVHCEAVRDERGEVRAVRGITRDVTSAVVGEQERRRERERAFLHAALLDQIDVAVIVTDLDRRVVSWNAGAERLYGWTREEALGRSARELVVAGEAESGELLMAALRRDGRWDGEYVVRRKDGSRFAAYIRNRVMYDEDGAEMGYAGVAIDVSERKESERALVRARNYLRAVTDSMGEALYTLDGEGRVDYMNPAAEDLLGWSLAEIRGRPAHEVLHGRRADGSVRPVEECAINRARTQGQLMRVDEDTFTRHDGGELPVAYTAAPMAGDEGVTGCVVVFEDITARKAEQRRVGRQLEKLAWMSRLQSALAEERFVLHGQPIVDLRSGEVVQRELLLRMREPGEGPERLVAPGAFLPVAEEFGLVAEIDRWVIDRAAELAAGGLPVELNVSARSICDARMIDHISEAISRAGGGGGAGRMVFEITETALIADEAAAGAFVEALHGLGCGIALDDFGTGYGGFTYLKNLPIDYLKIDTEFVRDLCSSSGSRHVVEAIVSLARGFGLMTVGEGVEDEQTLKLLRELGVDLAQGFHTGRPCPLPAALDGARRPAAAG